MGSMGLTIWAIVFLLFLSSACGVDLGSLETAHNVTNLQGICRKFAWRRGYDCEEFMVPTRDGYLLSMQRMSKAAVLNTEKEPVFLYHGLMQGGECWVLNEPKESLAFTLADTGYEVWIGSTRSSMFSYGHKIYNRSQEDFWDWNADDLASSDLPAMLYFVNSMTAKPILYVGYSQGTMAGFAGFTNPEIASLVKKAVMLSPIAYLQHVFSPESTLSTALFIDQWTLALGRYEFNVSGVSTICKEMNMDMGTCYNILQAFGTGINCCINKSMEVYYEAYESQSTSSKNMAHFAQLMRSGRFCKYDYGLLQNIEKYGVILPPAYDLSMIPKNLPFFLVYGGRDSLADALDVRHVASELPGEVELLFLPDYSHLDMMLGTSAKLDYYPSVLKFLAS